MELDLRSVDVRDTAAVAAGLRYVATDADPPDAVIYCPAIVGRGRVGELDSQAWRGVMEVNVFGAYTVLDQFARVFGSHPSRVVGLVSDAALCPPAARSAYASSKAALCAFLEAYREEVRPSGTTVTLLYLGKVDTTLSSRSAAENVRALQPSDIATVIAALLGLPPSVEVRSMQLSSVWSDYCRAARGDVVPP